MLASLDQLPGRGASSDGYRTTLTASRSAVSSYIPMPLSAYLASEGHQIMVVTLITSRLAVDLATDFFWPLCMYISSKQELSNEGADSH